MGCTQRIYAFFSDTTVCNAGWYGYSDVCYKFFLTAIEHREAAQHCLSKNGFLVTATVDSMTFLNQMHTVSAYKSLHKWWSGFIDQFGNKKYLTSTGTRLRNNDAGLFETSAVFGHLVHISWGEDDNGTFMTGQNGELEFPYICQTSNGKLAYT